jgi:hypothetical protein
VISWFSPGFKPLLSHSNLYHRYVAGTTGRTGGASDDDDDEIMLVDSYMSHPSSFGGSEGWGPGSGRRRVSQMSHRKASASFRTFGVDANNNNNDGGGGGGRGGAVQVEFS